jgi:hypothetical protein
MYKREVCKTLLKCVEYYLMMCLKLSIGAYKKGLVIFKPN